MLLLNGKAVEFSIDGKSSEGGILTASLQTNKDYVMSISANDLPVIEGKNKLTLPAGKATLKRKAVVAVYKDDVTGEVIKVGMVATNTGALSLAFAKDKETVPELTFTAEPVPGSTVLVTIEESNFQYTAVQSPASNPKTAGYYELVDGDYVKTNDTTVVSVDKVYFTKS